MTRTRPDRGDLLVAGQILCGAGLLWPGRSRWAVPAVVRLGAVGAVAAGSMVALAGARWLGRELRSHPQPSAGAVLRTDGPYAAVRHPIYAGLLLGAGGMALLRARREPLLAVAVLAGVLHVKARYEEGLLRARFGAAYDAYAAHVPRFVPKLTLQRRSGHWDLPNGAVATGRNGEVSGDGHAGRASA
ncbi:MAG: isoprenylcysteine carboxylmethyltransferase family protein [Jiangellaceae bacterium]|nr:isoprenylcysteine carboxylmethyltransferase family protein [Jiangellaceae bacterium]